MFDIIKISSTDIGYYKVLTGQNLMNICMQVYGTYDYLLYFLLTNGKDITDDLSAGEELIYNKNYATNNLIEIINVRGIIMTN